MRPQSLLAGLLASGSVYGLALPTTQNVDHVPFCSDVRWDGNSTELQTINCIQQFDSPSKSTTKQVDNESCTVGYEDDDTDTLNSTYSNSSSNPLHVRTLWNSTEPRVEARHACSGGDIPYRSKILTSFDETHKVWGFREGARPAPSDVTNMCKLAGKHFDPTKKKHRIYQIQRTKRAKSGNEEGSCYCILLRQGTAGLKLCNCDRCDALKLDFGVADMCRSLHRDGLQDIYASGYMKTQNPNALYALFGYKDGKGGFQEQVELDPVLGEEGVVPSTCISGDEKKQGQDFTGFILDCSWYDFWNKKCRVRFIKKLFNGSYAISFTSSYLNASWREEFTLDR